MSQIVPGSYSCNIINFNPDGYCPGDTISWLLESPNPTIDNVYIQGQIRGSKPSTSPRGFIEPVSPNPALPLLDFIFQGSTGSIVIPEDYAGYQYWFSNYLYFKDQPNFTSNFLTNCVSQQFKVKDTKGCSQKPSKDIGNFDCQIQNFNSDGYCPGEKIQWKITPLSDSVFDSDYYLKGEIYGNSPAANPDGLVGSVEPTQPTHLQPTGQSFEFTIPDSFVGCIGCEYTISPLVFLQSDSTKTTHCPTQPFKVKSCSKSKRSLKRPKA